jgi:hypothetical protein
MPRTTLRETIHAPKYVSLSNDSNDSHHRYFRLLPRSDTLPPTYLPTSPTVHYGCVSLILGGPEGAIRDSLFFRVGSDGRQLSTAPFLRS